MIAAIVPGVPDAVVLLVALFVVILLILKSR